MNDQNNFDKKMILSREWPMGGFLPLKRRDNDLDKKNLGFLYVWDTELIVYHQYVYGLEKGWKSTGPMTRYASVDELLADGWVVD